MNNILSTLEQLFIEGAKLAELYETLLTSNNLNAYRKKKMDEAYQKLYTIDTAIDDILTSYYTKDQAIELLKTLLKHFPKNSPKWAHIHEYIQTKLETIDLIYELDNTLSIYKLNTN